jgi:hypothetical protein
MQEEIRHEAGEGRGEFYLEGTGRDAGRRLARLTYTERAGFATLDHTEVDDSLRGTGAGKRLLEAAVEWARREERKLKPVCSFARAQFDRTPAFADVLQR